MKIICTKTELAEMLTHCVPNRIAINAPCKTCVLYERCDGAFIDTLMAQVEVKDNEAY